MFGLRDSKNASRRRLPVTIGPGGLAPIVVLAAVFGGFGAKAGLPVGMSALLGGIGGTASALHPGDQPWESKLTPSGTASPPPDLP